MNAWLWLLVGITVAWALVLGGIVYVLMQLAKDDDPDVTADREADYSEWP